MTKLNDAELQQAMAHLPGWTTEGGAIQRNFKFADFVAAMAFVNRVAELAEQAQHHPDIDIRYNQVKIALSTHDAGGITKKDADMAAKIERARD
jgi:4a-hydroxytetrahydrobiopterin dehydratase